MLFHDGTHALFVLRKNKYRATQHRATKKIAPRKKEMHGADVPNETKIRQALTEASQERGGQSALASALDIHPSTVKRWVDGGEIPPPMIILLDWYFFGTMPPRLVQTLDLQGVLEFTEDEWNIIGLMAKRAGQTHAQWIRSSIIAYVTFQGPGKHESQARKEA